MIEGLDQCVLRLKQCRMMMNRVVEMYSVYTECYQCGLCQRQQSWIGGLDKARCDDIGDLSGDVAISFRLRHEWFTLEL